MATIPDLALPKTLSSTAIDAVFTADATVGARLSSLTDKRSTIALVPNDDQARCTGGNGSMWRIKGAIPAEVTNDPQWIEVGPEDAAEFSAYGPFTSGNSESVMFEWRGIVVPDTEARLSVRLVARIADTTVATDEVEWLGWLFRENDAGDFHVRAFVYPYHVLEGFSAPRASESQWEAQARTRVLVPIALGSFLTHCLSNYPANGFVTLGRFDESTYTCPGVLKMPWITVCSGNNLGTEFRQNFAVRAKRTSGHVLGLWWQYLTDNPAAPTTSHVELGIAHIPSMLKDHGHHLAAPDGFAHESYTAGTWGPRFVSVTEVFTSLTNDFWFDIIERHRSFYLSTTSVPCIDDNTVISPLTKRGGLFYATWVQGKTRELERIAMENYVEFGELLMEVFKSDHMETSGSIAHQQTHQHGFGGDVGGETVSDADKSVLPDYLPGMFEAIAALRLMGYRPELYSIVSPMRSPMVWRDWLYDEGLQATTSITAGASGGVPTDKHDSALMLQHALRVTRDMVGTAGLGGIHSDTLTGAASITYSVKRPSTNRRHPSGGGDWSAVNRRAGMLAMRPICASASAFAAAGIDPNFYVVSETTEEFMNDACDGAGDGYMFQGGHFWFLEDELATDSLGFPYLQPASIKSDYPRNFRQMHPPLFRIAHHEWCPSFNFSVDLINEPLATVQSPNPGLTGAQLADAFCYHRALVANMGVIWVMQTIYLDDISHAAVQLTPNGLVVDAAIDPSGAGLTMAAFMKTCFEAMADGYGREWLVFGRAERDLGVDYDAIATQQNPAFAYTVLNGFNLGLKLGNYGNYPFYNETAANLRFGNMDFQVPRVLNSVWRNPKTNAIGIVLINWSSSAADWEGVFDPTLYGIVGAYDVRRRTLGGAPVTLASGLTGAKSLASSAAPSGDVHLGHLAARSVTILEIV